MESGHVVVSGWSPIVPALVSELCSREKEVGGTVVVLLTELPKIDVENVLREHINFSNSHVVVRTGDTAKAEDLEKVSVKDARTVLVVSPADHTRRLVTDEEGEAQRSMRHFAWQLVWRGNVFDAVPGCQEPVRMKTNILFNTFLELPWGYMYVFKVGHDRGTRPRRRPARFETSSLLSASRSASSTAR